MSGIMLVSLRGTEGYWASCIQDKCPPHATLCHHKDIFNQFNYLSPTLSMFSAPVDQQRTGKQGKTFSFPAAILGERRHSFFLHCRVCLEVRTGCGDTTMASNAQHVDWPQVAGFCSRNHTYLRHSRV